VWFFPVKSPQPGRKEGGFHKSGQHLVQGRAWGRFRGRVGSGQGRISYPKKGGLFKQPPHPSTKWDPAGRKPHLLSRKKKKGKKSETGGKRGEELAKEQQAMVGLHKKPRPKLGGGERKKPKKKKASMLLPRGRPGKTRSWGTPPGPGGCGKIQHVKKRDPKGLGPPQREKRGRKVGQRTVGPGSLGKRRYYRPREKVLPPSKGRGETLFTGEKLGKEGSSPSPKKKRFPRFGGSELKKNRKGPGNWEKALDAAPIGVGGGALRSRQKGGGGPQKGRPKKGNLYSRQNPR